MGIAPVGFLIPDQPPFVERPLVGPVSEDNDRRTGTDGGAGAQGQQAEQGQQGQEGQRGQEGSEGEQGQEGQWVFGWETFSFELERGTSQEAWPIHVDVHGLIFRCVFVLYNVHRNVHTVIMRMSRCKSFSMMWLLVPFLSFPLLLG